ncbi:transposase family protein [Streptomyces sp. NPDC056202]
MNSQRDRASHQAALLTYSHLRMGHTYAQLAAEFGVDATAAYYTGLITDG